METNNVIYNEFSPTPTVGETINTNERFVKSIVNNQKDMPEDMSKYIDEHFWELV